MVSIYLMTWRNMVRKNFSIFPTLDMHDYGSDCFNVKCAWLERDDDTFGASDCFSVKYAWLEREDDTLDTSVKYLCKTFVIQFLLKKQWAVYFYFLSFIHGFDNGPRRGWVEAKKNRSGLRCDGTCWLVSSRRDGQYCGNVQSDSWRRETNVNNRDLW